MNERIKQLLKQATREVNPDDREWVFSKVDQEKFAELIVKECAAYFREAEGTAHGLEEHFGIEE